MNDLDKVYAESVAKDYMPKETNKVRQLKKLDERAKLPAFITAMTLGIIGTLIFGTGNVLWTWRLWNRSNFHGHRGASWNSRCCNLRHQLSFIQEAP